MLAHEDLLLETEDYSAHMVIFNIKLSITASFNLSSKLSPMALFKTTILIIKGRWNSATNHTQ